MSAERKQGFIEKSARVSKTIDIVSFGAGYIIGGPIGISLMLWSGATYLIADNVEKRTKKNN